LSLDGLVALPLDDEGLGAAHQCFYSAIDSGTPAETPVLLRRADGTTEVCAASVHIFGKERLFFLVPAANRRLDQEIAVARARARDLMFQVIPAGIQGFLREEADDLRFTASSAAVVAVRLGGFLNSCGGVTKSLWARCSSERGVQR
jgi:hypothetical protein